MRFPSPRSTATALALAVSTAAAPARAQTPPDLPLWEIGAFGIGVSQQAYPGSDEQVNRSLAVPYFIYRGEVLRADRGAAGLRALKTPRFELDVGFAGSFAARSNEIDARRGMPDLGTLVEFGPRLRWKLGEGLADGRWRLDVPLRGVFDLNARAAHRGMTLEPELSFERRSLGSWSYTTSLSAVLADARLASTFYSVEAPFVLPDRPAYAARSGLVAWRLSASLSRPLGTDWRWFGFARLDSVRGAANETSPLVRRTEGATVGLGVAYTWRRSERRATE